MKKQVWGAWCRQAWLWVTVVLLLNSYCQDARHQDTFHQSQRNRSGHNLNPCTSLSLALAFLVWIYPGLEKFIPPRPPLLTCLDASQISGSDLQSSDMLCSLQILTALQLIHLLMLDDQCYHQSQEVKVTLISNEMMGF